MDKPEPDNAEAIKRYERGDRLGVSTGICGSITYGYGRLSGLGYFEFPLYRSQLRADDKLRELPEMADWA